MGVRKLLEFLERLFAVVFSRQGRRACKALGIEPSSLFTGLDSTGLPKLQLFLAKRLPRG